MKNLSAIYPYILAILFGFTVFFFPATELFSPTLALVYLFGGGLFGYFWPEKSWRWGFWIAVPITTLLGLSLLFAGQPDMFMKKDLPLLLLIITAGCFGGFMVAWFKRNQMVKNQSTIE